MTLSEEEKASIRLTIQTVDKLNICLGDLRSKGFACNIREEPHQSIGRLPRWLLDVKALVRGKDYAETIK